MGLSTINRELAIQLAKFPEVKITPFLPKCSQEDRKIALEHKAKIVQATPLPPAFEQLDWFFFPPKDLQIDVIVGHGVKLGKNHKSLKTVKGANGFKWYTQTQRNLGYLKGQFQRVKKGAPPK